MTGNLHGIASAYVEAAGRAQDERLPALLDPDIEFRGPYVTLRGAQQYLAALQRLAPVRLRHDLRKVFVDGQDVCVIYDFVTDTPAGAVPFVEWLKFEGGKVRSIQLFFDREQFAPARETLQRLARGPAAS